MVMSCSAFGCTNRYHKEKNISFHSFPKNPSILKKWLPAIRRESFIPGRTAKLCSEHFRPDDFIINFGKKSLKSDTVPSILNIPKHLEKKPVKLRSRRPNAVDEQGPSFPSASREVVDTSQDLTGITGVQGSLMDIAQETASDNANAFMESTLSERKTLVGRRKRSVPAYMGDIESSDLENPKKVKLMWQIANRTIAKQKQTIKYLQTKVRRSNKKIITLCELITHLKNSNKITPECYSILEVYI